MRKLFALTGLLLLLGVFAGATTLTSNNSSLAYNDTDSFTAWAVEGTDNLYRESWYYRVGSGAGAILSGPAMVPIGSNAGQVNYVIPGWGQVTMFHVLLGNAPGTYNSQWSSTLSFTRAQGVADPLYFYNYADYDLFQTISNDTAGFVGLGLFGQSDVRMGLTYNVSNPPNYIHVGPCCGINANSNLDNDPGPYTGDAIFASEFVITSDSFSYSIDRSLNQVPEPGTYALIGAGLLGLGLLRRRMS